MKQPLKVPHLAGREKPLLKLGLSPTDATWLTLACSHSGVFTRRQYTDLHQCHRMAAHRLVRRLIDAGLANERHGTSLKVNSRPWTRPLPRPPHPVRATPPRRAPLRLSPSPLCLDHVAENLSLPWLPTEIDKLEYFLCRGCPPSDLPQRTYAGAANDTRRYFHHQLPIAADDHRAIFLYADPGRDSRAELRSWADSHRRLWTHLRDQGTSVHVAAIVRTRAARDDYDRILAAWLSPRAPIAPLTPDDADTLAAIERALRSGQPDALAPWGGFQAARRILLPLRRRAEQAGAAAPRLIDSFSTHHAHRLSADSLAR